MSEPCTHADLVESADGDFIECQGCGRGSVDLVADLCEAVTALRAKLDGTGTMSSRKDDQGVELSKREASLLGLAWITGEKYHVPLEFFTEPLGDVSDVLSSMVNKELLWEEAFSDGLAFYRITDLGKEVLRKLWSIDEL